MVSGFSERPCLKEAGGQEKRTLTLTSGCFTHSSRLSVCLFVTGCGTQGLFSLSEHCVAWGGGLPRSVVLLLSTVIRFMSLPSLWGEGGAV